MKTYSKVRKTKVFTLAMNNRSHFVPKDGYLNRLRVRYVPNNMDTSLMMFISVGMAWGWNERLSWTKRDWRLHFEKQDVYTYFGFLGENMIGYFELIHHPSNKIEIRYFGLLPKYIGKGLGGHFLSQVIHTAWRFYPESIYLETSDLDSQYTLNNYLSRGLTIEKEDYRLEKLAKEEDYRNILQKILA